jgi:HEAT repeat protein
MSNQAITALAAGRIFLRALAVVLALCLGPAAALSAQQTGSTAPKKEITIEELFLQSVELQILREKAFSGDYDIKMSALDDLEKKVNDGSYKGSDQQVEFVLEYLAMEGSAHTTREAGRLVNNFPEVRRRAANLLGRVGTPEAKEALVRVLLIDEEPIVKAEAAYALGVIGNNDNNEVVKALAFTFSKEDPAKPDNNFGYAMCLAVEKLSTKAGGLKDPAAYQILVKIAQGNYLRTVRTKALQVLDALKSSK